MKRSVKTWVYLSVIVFCVCLIIACNILLKQNRLINAENIESHARSFQNIPDKWLAETGIGNNIAALIFYPADSSDAIYSIYLCRGNNGIGFSFRAGGKISSVENGITQFSIDGYNEIAYISMNKQKICKLTIDDGSNIKTMVLDSSKPFALILPSNAGNVSFYDTEDNIVEITDRNF